eukprot:6182030-Pleurochrysis_carterae.AAC.1
MVRMLISAKSKPTVDAQVERQEYVASKYATGEKEIKVVISERRHKRKRERESETERQRERERARERERESARARARESER